MRNLWLVLVVAACSKGGGSGPEAAVRGFVEAVAAGDVDKARAYMPDDAACEQAPADKVAHCKESARRMREEIPELADDFRRGTKVTKVERSKEPSPDPSIALWRVELDGDDHAELFTIDLGGKTYVAFPIKVKSADPPTSR